jgi:hypothetical protein
VRLAREQRLAQRQQVVAVVDVQVADDDGTELIGRGQRAEGGRHARTAVQQQHRLVGGDEIPRAGLAVRRHPRAATQDRQVHAIQPAVRALDRQRPSRYGRIGDAYRPAGRPAGMYSGRAASSTSRNTGTAGFGSWSRQIACTVT